MSAAAFTVEPMAVTPSPGSVNYRSLLAWRGPLAQRGTIVTELADAHPIKLHFELGGPATAELVVDGRAPTCALIQELSQDVCVYRWNPYTASYEILFRGVVGHTEDAVGDTNHTVTVQSTDYRAMLARRPVGGPLTFTQADQFTIADGLVQGPLPFGGQGTAYDMGIAPAILRNPDGTHVPSALTGVKRDRSYTGAEKSGEMLDNLSKVIDGFDWGCEPVDVLHVATPPNINCQPTVWYPQRGVTKSFVADYGGTVAEVKRTVDSTTFANWIRNDGQAVDDVAVYAVAAGDVVTNPQLHPEGLWPEGTSSSSTETGVSLQEQANSRLAEASVLVPSYSLVLAPGAWNWKNDAWLGDTIPIKIRSGRLKVDTAARILALDFDVNENGIERITVTVARVVPTLVDMLIETASRLDALSRR